MTPAPPFPRPLEGVRILDLSAYLPGPYCSTMLAAFGATVLKVEPPGGDPVRRMNPPMFHELNREKESLVLDLKQAADRQVLRRMVPHAHVLLESLRPGVMERLGAGYEALAALNPALVYCAITGFGHTGPYRDRAAHDIASLAIGGYFSVPSQIRTVHTRPHIRLADILAAQGAALSVVMGVLEARASGRGRFIDLAMFDAVASHSAQMIACTPALGTGDVDRMPLVMADSDLYRTRDGREIVIATLEDKFWLAFAQAASDLHPELASPDFSTREGRNREKRRLQRVLEHVFAQLTLAEWGHRLAEVDTIWAPVYEGHEVLGDPHFQARGLVQASPSSGHLHALFPALFSGRREALGRSAPSIGEVSDGTLEAFGVSREDLPRAGA